jgi:hypothetical protein
MDNEIVIIRLSETGTKPWFQGDILLKTVAVGESAAAKPLADNIVAHSETGHHHTAEGGTVLGLDPMTMFLQPDGKGAIDGVPFVDIVHHRDYDTHKTYRLFFDVPDAIVKIKRQREQTPSGWRRVED